MSKKGENIYKRKDGRWEARYIREYNSDGSAHYGYCYGKTYGEAKEKVSQARCAILNQEQISEKGEEKRFSSYCDEWLRLKRSKVKESTYIKYGTVLEKHIKPKLGRYYAKNLSEILVEQFGYELLTKEKLSAKTVKDILSVLQSVLSYTAKKISGMRNVEVVYPKETHKEMRVLSREEQKQFTKYLLTDMDECKFGVLLALMTGMRLGEICALKWKDISLHDQTVFVRQTMQRLKNANSRDERRTRVVFSTPKSGMSIRVIPLNDSMTELCEKWKREDSDAYVLTGKRERYIEPRTLQYRLKQYTKECGLEGVHFHTLRHSFATRCVEAGFEIKSLSEILGHSSPKVTLERYVHSSMELKRENMNKLNIVY